MQIKVKGYLTYKELVGEQFISVEERDILTIAGLLSLLAAELDKDFSNLIFDPQANELGEYVAVIINGRSYSNLPEKLNTQLKDGDEVAIFPPMVGG